jgi:hypothetical protein
MEKTKRIINCKMMWQNMLTFWLNPYVRNNFNLQNLFIANDGTILIITSDHGNI